MPPREATNPFPDQYLTLDYETSGPIILPHDNVGVGDNDGGAAVGGMVDDGAADEQSFGGGGADPQQEEGDLHLDPVVMEQTLSGAHGEGSGGQPQPSSDPLGMTDIPPGLTTSTGEVNFDLGGSLDAHSIENPNPNPPPPSVSPSHSVTGGSASSSRRRSDRGGGNIDPLSIDPTPSASEHLNEGGSTPASRRNRLGSRRQRGRWSSSQDPQAGLGSTYVPVNTNTSVGEEHQSPGSPRPHGDHATAAQSTTAFPFGLTTPPPGSPPPNVTRTGSSASSSSSSSSIGDSTAPLSTGSPFPISEPTSPLLAGEFGTPAADNGGSSGAVHIGTSLVGSAMDRSAGISSGSVVRPTDSPVASHLHTNRLLRAYQRGLPLGPVTSDVVIESEDVNGVAAPTRRPSRMFQRGQRRPEQQLQQSLPPHQLFGSVLDNSTTLESDDEDGDEDSADEYGDVPMLGITRSQSEAPLLDTTNISDTTDDADDEGGPGIGSETDASAVAGATSHRHSFYHSPHQIITDEDVSEASSQASFLTPGSTASPGVAGLYDFPHSRGGSQDSGSSHSSRGSQDSGLLALQSSNAFDDSGSEGHTHRPHQAQPSFQPHGSPLFPPQVPGLSSPYAVSPSAHNIEVPHSRQHRSRHRQNHVSRQAQGYAMTSYQSHPAAQSHSSRGKESSNSSSYSQSPTPGTSSLSLSFGPSTTVSDLTYFAERGCIVALLTALDTPRLKTLGSRMLADYAKMGHRRVAVASNRRILEFVSRTMLEAPSIEADGEDDGMGEMGPDWLAREYAVETVRSLTATEESDRHLMSCPGLLRTLALVARGGPFVSVSCDRDDKIDDPILSAQGEGETQGHSRKSTLSLASPKARLHACIAVMNLSCGKSNKVEIANVSEVLEAMRDVMLGAHFIPQDSRRSGSSLNAAEEARLKAVTCIKNLSNADANDAALLGTPGLVEALGCVALSTCSSSLGGKGGGASSCTTNACLALMNLSISKSNKHRVFRTPGVMDALMAVINRTAPSDDNQEGNGNSANGEARVKACSALSNLAIGYDNKIPMFAYPGFVDAILRVIETDDGEARTKACSILWSFAAEMKNQVPVSLIWSLMQTDLIGYLLFLDCVGYLPCIYVLTFCSPSLLYL